MFAKVSWWRFLANAFAWAALSYVAAVAALFIMDPYGRSGLRPSDKISNLPERLLMVSRAMDPAFDAAIVGNSTSMPLQPEALDSLTDRHFVSLSMSGSQSPAAIATARFFLRQHPSARDIVIALDDSWCTRGADVDETHPFPFWLYKNNISYVMGLLANASTSMFAVGISEPGNNRIDGYHPYDETFRRNNAADTDRIRDRINRLSRPTQARYAPPFRFEPPVALGHLIEEFDQSTDFILLWTPRYITLIPAPNTSAAEADHACKLQVNNLFAQRKNVRIVDWSGSDHPENLDPENFYETNHYRNTIAALIERDIASSIQDIGG